MSYNTPSLSHAASWLSYPAPWLSYAATQAELQRIITELRRSLDWASPHPNSYGTPNELHLSYVIIPTSLHLPSAISYTEPMFFTWDLTGTSIAYAWVSILRYAILWLQVSKKWLSFRLGQPEIRLYDVRWRTHALFFCKFSPWLDLAELLYAGVCTPLMGPLWQFP